MVMVVEVMTIAALLRVIVDEPGLVREIHPQHKRWIDNAATDRQGASS